MKKSHHNRNNTETPYSKEYNRASLTKKHSLKYFLNGEADAYSLFLPEHRKKQGRVKVAGNL